MREIIKILEKLAYKHSTINIFQDFIALMALEMSIKTECLIKDVSSRAEAISRIVEKYSEDELKYYEKFKELIIKEISENKFQDLLGVIFHELALQNKYKGQFFTPYTVSYATAKLSIGKFQDEKDIYYIGEPAGGSGGMCIAVCQIAEEQEVNYASKLLFDVNDVDITCVYMSYIQLSLIGAAAIIKHKNTLSLEYFDNFITLGAILNRSLERLRENTKNYKVIAEQLESKKTKQYVFNF